MQILMITLHIQTLWKMIVQVDGVIISSLPSVLAYFFWVEHVSFLLLSVLIRYIILNYSHMRRALQTIRKVHDALRVDDLSAEHIPAVKKRIMVGFIFSLMCVSILYVKNNQ